MGRALTPGQTAFGAVCGIGFAGFMAWAFFGHHDVPVSHIQPDTFTASATASAPTTTWDGSPGSAGAAPSGAPYELGVPPGQPCSPTVAYYYARGDSTVLQVNADQYETAGYSLTAKDPSQSGAGDEAMIETGMTGHEFTIEIPIDQIASVEVIVSGTADKQRGTCIAAPS